MLGSLIDYWYYTGDDQWNNLTMQGLLFQTGPNNDYMPPNQTMDEGNDDQGFWGMAVMSAAEYNFPNPPAGKPSWLALAQAVFNTQAYRWDSTSCGGGLRWQIFLWNNGFNYKNSISQGCFFNMAARLALYTGNQTYADWADKTWDWMVTNNLIESGTYYIPDGLHTDNCSNITPYQWTYNAGVFLLGAAAMYNFTTGSTQDMWRERVQGLLNGTHIFFTGNGSNIMTEVACEPVHLCDLDAQSFKAYLSRWMAATTKWAPWTYSYVKPLLAASAQAAAAQCTGGSNGRMCGLIWNDNGKWDGTTGVGQQMDAMEVTLGNMIQDASSPVTNSTGGTSTGDPAAGGSDIGNNNPNSAVDYMAVITTGDKAGAGILTILIVVALSAWVAWLMLDETSDKAPHRQVARFATGVATGRFLRKKPRYGGGGGAGAGPASAKGLDDGASNSSSDRTQPLSSVGVMSHNPSRKTSAIESQRTSGTWAPPMRESGQSGPIYVRDSGSLSEPPRAPQPPVSTRDHRASNPGDRKRSSLRKQAAQNARYASAGSVPE